jgi:hypothetical protein
MHNLRFVDILPDQILACRTFGLSILHLLRSSYFSGFRNKEVAFLHSPSKTLIAADLIFNLPATEQVVLFFFTTFLSSELTSFPVF